VKLPAAKADVTFNYYDEISEELLTQYGLVNEMSKEMLKAIGESEFGDALTKLMDKHICNYSGRLLKSVTGLDIRTISNMKKGENLTKLNVISACLGIHIPYRVSDRMLQLADLSLNMTSPGKIGADNETYDMLLHLKWATDYGDVYDELKEQSLDYLIHQPPL
jgi:type I restriction enzyme R subunit